MQHANTERIQKHVGFSYNAMLAGLEIVGSTLFASVHHRLLFLLHIQNSWYLEDFELLYQIQERWFILL